MTLQEVKTIRDKYMNAILQLNMNMLTHSLNGASYDHDAHRDSLEKAFQYWDTMYNRKISGGRTRRLDRKAV